MSSHWKPTIQHPVTICTPHDSQRFSNTICMAQIKPAQTSAAVERQAYLGLR
ncbi:hypothetical protein PCANC_17738 [Puccinia coronata f. sp. avenae]|uniref:Uncharacterized protein n=1 Tax=Puccinia coronata f. sp. avenae TaxID=200324 RepID=A0A2N5UYT0_9BASI|nr:hypothetical protein PCANC_17738 [Puccinia coronata f. sp. avenae]